jgi:hypothetical protein
MVAAIVAVVGFVGFTLFSGGNDSGKQPVAGKPSVVSPIATISTPAHPQAVTPTPMPSGSPIAAAPADRVTVKLTADGGQSWIQAADSNGRVLYEGSLAMGDAMMFTDGKKISLVVGNAGAVSLFVNGRDLGPAGNKGQVVRLNFTPGDPQAG